MFDGPVLAPLGITNMLILLPVLSTRLLRVNSWLRGPVYGFNRTVAVPFEAEATSLTVRGHNRFYGLSSFYGTVGCPNCND
jgi:hypothetical protein